MNASELDTEKIEGKKNSGMLLSIDVGTKNMGVAVVDRAGRSGPRLVDFALPHCCTVKKPTIERACRDVFRALTEYLDKLAKLPVDVDECMIEAQPRKNCRTKVLSHCIQVLMLGRGCSKVSFVSPKKKLKVKYKKYADRKKAAVAEATRVVALYPDLYLRFCALAKKDDVADAILQTQLDFYFPAK